MRQRATMKRGTTLRARPKRDPEYEHNKAAVYARDGHRCVHCGSDQITPQHVKKRSQGGGHDRSNLLTLCGGPNSCHDRADNVASTHGKLHITALGDERYRIFDERSESAYLYELSLLGSHGPTPIFVKRPMALDPHETAILEVRRRRAELKQETR